MKFNQLLKVFGFVFLFYACDSDDNPPNEAVSIIGTWNLIEFNDNPDEVYCPKTLEITTDTYTEIEYGGLNCDDEYSFSRSYTLSGNTFEVINPDIDNTTFDIISLTESELIWETITPNANQVLKYTYERVE